MSDLLDQYRRAHSECEQRRRWSARWKGLARRLLWANQSMRVYMLGLEDMRTGRDRLAAELAHVTGERDSARRTYDEQQHELHALAAELAEARAEVERLRACDVVRNGVSCGDKCIACLDLMGNVLHDALVKAEGDRDRLRDYAVHKIGCDANEDEVCVCGLDELTKRAKAAAGRDT